jgi:hypothetical protein
MTTARILKPALESIRLSDDGGRVIIPLRRRPYWRRFLNAYRWARSVGLSRLVAFAHAWRLNG